MIPQQKYYDENRGKDLRKSPERQHWVVSKMWDLHHEIARMIMLGWKNVEIADKLGITSQTVSNVRNSPVVQEHVAVLQAARDADTVDISKEIKEIVPEAMELLKDIIRGDNDGRTASISLRAREANNMLARVGHGVPHKVQSESVSMTLTSKDIEEIKRRARLAKDLVQEAEVIDSETVEEVSNEHDG